MLWLKWQLNYDQKLFWYGEEKQQQQQKYQLGLLPSNRH